MIKKAEKISRAICSFGLWQAMKGEAGARWMAHEAAQEIDDCAHVTEYYWRSLETCTDAVNAKAQILRDFRVIN